MANAFQDKLGVTTEERVINAFNLGSDVSTRNIGLLVERQRGVENKPILVNGLKEDKRIFGDHVTSMYSSYVVENLLNNTGGYSVNLYEVRIVGTGSVASTTTVVNASANTQTFIKTTTQVAGLTTPQIDSCVITNVEVGDQFTIVVAGTDDPTATAVPFTHTKTVTAVLNDTALILLTAIKADLDIYFATLVTPISCAIVAGKLVITGLNNSAITTTTSTVNDATNAEIFEVVAGRQGEADKGTWGDDLRVKVYPIGHASGSPDGYRMEVFYLTYLVETFTSTADDWQTLVDAVNQRSEFIMINPIDLDVALTLNVFDGALSGGAYVAPTTAQMQPAHNSTTGEAEGMAIFEGVDVQIIACPEIFTADYAKLCDDFARGVNKFFVFNLPYLATESVVTTFFNTLFTPDQSFIAGYLNWAEVPADKNGNKIWIPAVGYALGAGYIRKAGLYNGYVWTPPAGVETNAKGVFRFTHDNLSEDQLGRYVKKWRCNVIKYVKNVGFCLWSSRTYSNNTLFESIHVRLETNWVIANVKVRNEKYVQRINTPSLQKDMKVDNLIWFKNIYEQGGIERSIKFEDAVIVDITTSKENRKEMEMEIAWIPPECIEHIHIKVSRNDGILVLNFS